MFKKILVPVDGSSTSWRALETAKDLAVKYDGELISSRLTAVPIFISTAWTRRLLLQKMTS